MRSDGVECSGDVVDSESNVVSARGDASGGFPPRGSSFGTLLGGMDLHAPSFEPHTRKVERRPRDFLHAKEVDIEAARGFEIGANKSNVVKRVNSQRG